VAALGKPGVKAPFPGFIEPALASSIGKVPGGQRWLHEIKFDGYRVQVHLRDAAVKVFTRRGNDWTNRLGKVASDAWHINTGSAIIDGEVVVPTADGTTDFSVLQNELKGRSSKIVVVAGARATGSSPVSARSANVPCPLARSLFRRDAFRTGIENNLKRDRKLRKSAHFRFIDSEAVNFLS
jgi:hypothetical protein